MADVYAVFGTLIGLGIAYPGMLTAWWLLFPRIVNRASERLERTPWRCLVVGAMLAVPLAILIAMLMATAFGPIKFVGFTLLLGSLAFATWGAAGLAALMGNRLASKVGPGGSPLTGFLRGALALELASAFPGIGWFLVIPFGTLAAFGAASFALVGWMPAAQRGPAIEPALGPVVG